MTGPPLRLMDDAIEDAGLRADLSRFASTRVPYDRVAGLARLQQAIGAAPSPPNPLPKRIFVRGKWWGLGAVAAVGMGAMVAARTPSAPPYVGPRATDLAPSAAVASPAPSQEHAVWVEDLPTVKVEPTTSARSTDRARAAVPSSSTPATDTLREEMDHLAALREEAKRDPEQALRHADEGNRRFSSGIFMEEREAIAILMLARLHRQPEARARAADFLARHPRGPFTERVQRETREIP